MFSLCSLCPLCPLCSILYGLYCFLSPLFSSLSSILFYFSPLSSSLPCINSTTRLVKNREYASQSRTRKKQYVDELEKHLETARAEAETYKKQNHMLMEENKVLKRQLGHIAEAIKKTQQVGTSGVGMGGVSVGPVGPAMHHGRPNVVPGMFVNFGTIGGGRHAVPSKTVSACLLVCEQKREERREEKRREERR
jgi:bZIP transcription factor